MSKSFKKSYINRFICDVSVLDLHWAKFCQVTNKSIMCLWGNLFETFGKQTHQTTKKAEVELSFSSKGETLSLKLNFPL